MVRRVAFTVSGDTEAFEKAHAAVVKGEKGGISLSSVHPPTFSKTRIDNDSKDTKSTIGLAFAICSAHGCYDRPFNLLHSCLGIPADV